jgi:cell volume regulation protein A
VSATLNVALLLGATVLLVAVGAVRFSTRIGVPSLLVYLALGLAIGEAGLGIEFNDADLTRALGTCALLLIIAEGGLTARWSALRPVLGLAATLSTLGVFVSIAVVGVVVHLLLDVGWQLAFLYGAVLSSTDAAAVFATLRRLPLRHAPVATLEAESGLNDAPVVLVVTLLSTGAFDEHPWWATVGLIGYELLAGALIGLVIGAAGGWLLRRAALPAAGLYPLATVALTVLGYASGTALHASGFLAVYVTGVVLGNARLPHRHAILGFADGVAWLAQIGLFVLLGLLAWPSRLLEAVLPALIVGIALTLLARPLSVLLSAVGFRVPWREQVFLSAAGLRGAVPIVLATIPLSERVPGAQALFNVVFVLVVVFTLVQGGSLAGLARRLRITAPEEATELQVETAPLDRMRADLLQVRVPAGSRLAGVFVDELRLPPGAVVTLVLRDGSGFVPDRYTRLRRDDELLNVATVDARDLTEIRIRAVSRHGRLARWLTPAAAGQPGAPRRLRARRWIPGRKGVSADRNGVQSEPGG